MRVFDPTEPLPVTIELDGRTSLEGEAADASGKPLQGALVTVRSVRRSGGSFSSFSFVPEPIQDELATATGEAGRFLLQGLP